MGGGLRAPGRAAGPGRRPASRAARPHPFAADPDVLADALGELGDGPRDLAGKAAADELSLWLPSAGPGPASSPELIRPAGEDGAANGPGRGRRAALGCWRVPALAFSPAAALTILAAVDPVDTPPGEVSHPDLAAGGSVVYWAAVARFAGDLCIRGRVLPGLSQGSGGWTASWRTVLTGPDAPRAAELAGAMPPMCRAGEPGGEPPGPLLAAALDALADAVARARLDAPAPLDVAAPVDVAALDMAAPQNGPSRLDASAGVARPRAGDASPGGPPGRSLLPPRRGRRPARVPVPERWMAALAGPDAEVEVATAEDEGEAAGLAAALDAWHAAAQAPAGPCARASGWWSPCSRTPIPTSWLPGPQATRAPALPLISPPNPPAASPPGPPMGCGRSSSPCSHRRIPA